MPPSDAASLRDLLGAAEPAPERRLWAHGASVALDSLVRRSRLGSRLAELRGRSVLLTTGDQLAAAVALVELDGVARRIVLCPPDLSEAHLPVIATAAAVDTVVCDRAAALAAVQAIADPVLLDTGIEATLPDTGPRLRTEWVLLTSGTTGPPKLVLHTLATLSGAISPAGTPEPATVWSTFYDIRRYGGLQILLRALLGGHAMVLSSAGEAVEDHLGRALEHHVTRISGTPSHWRRALMSGAAGKIAPLYVRLSGEIADQAILDRLRAVYPRAGVAHAFASTEAGVAFDVGDGLAGFPAGLIGRRGTEVEMRVVDGSLRIRSPRTALRYLGAVDEALQDGEGFVDTGDLVELRDDRYQFVGRNGGIINVGGLKVHPEEVEAVINRHPDVHMSLVRSRRNPITGAVVVAEVVLQQGSRRASAAEAPAVLQDEILAACRHALPAHKVPAVIRFVERLEMGAAGKLARVTAA